MCTMLLPNYITVCGTELIVLLNSTRLSYLTLFDSCCLIYP